MLRYVLTYMNRDGLRQLYGPAQGRHTFATAAEAQQHLNAVKANNNHEMLARTFGPRFVPSLAVRPCDCWPGHFDPKGIYFDLDANDFHSLLTEAFEVLGCRGEGDTDLYKRIETALIISAIVPPRDTFDDDDPEPRRYRVLTLHGESASVYFVVDSTAPEPDQPKIIEQHRDYESAHRHAEGLNIALAARTRT